MKILTLTLAITAITSGAALADGPAPAPQTPVVIAPAPSVYNWSGAYIGAFAGMSEGSYTPFDPNGIGPGVDVDGGIFGLTAGYNWQNGNIVYGAMLDISNGPEGETAQGTTGPFWSCNTGACNASIETLVTLRGRVGYAMNETLLFASAGAAWADVEGGIYNSAQQGGGDATGWVAGLGVEQAIGTNSSLVFEVLHYDLGDIPFGTGIGTLPFEGDGDFSSFRLGFNYRF